MPVFVVEVLVVDVLVVDVVQLLHSTGQSLLSAAPNSGCTHWDASIAPQNAGSTEPLQTAVVVVVLDVVAVDVVVALVVEVAVIVVVVRDVVVVVSTQLLQRTKHLDLNTMPMSPAAAQYF